MPTAPLSPYALQKLVAEQYCQMFTQLYGLETVTIRYFNVFGPRQDPSSPYSGVISLFISALVRGTPADDLRRRRADARLHLCRQRRRRRAARVHGAGGQRRSDQRRDRRPHLAQPAVSHACAIWSGANVEPIYEEPRAGDVRDSQADITKARRLLGYEPIVTLRGRLSTRTVAWYRTSQVTGRVSSPPRRRLHPGRRSRAGRFYFCRSRATSAALRPLLNARHGRSARRIGTSLHLPRCHD